MRTRAVVAATTCLLALAGCGDGPDTAVAPPPAPAAAPTAAPDGPSAQAAMICTDEAREDIATFVGVDALRIGPPSWSDHVYACSYTYPDGTLDLSVKDLPDEQQTTAYIDRLATELGRTGDLPSVAQGAFRTSNGSVVLRKDDKVLLVDVRGLPARFGRPPVGPPEAAVLVAKAILSCWE